MRTVCVRLSDSYFWPISYATLPDYVSNDVGVCQASCPTTPVALYFYDNPGQEPKQMHNAFGEALYRPVDGIFLPQCARYQSECQPQGQAAIGWHDPNGRAD